MNIERLQKALEIMNKSKQSGTIFAEHDEINLWPTDENFTKDEISQLDELGFIPNDEGGFICFT